MVNYSSYSVIVGGNMETVIEYALIFLWDLIKTVILQWLSIKLKNWWDSRKNYWAPQYA